MMIKRLAIIEGGIVANIVAVDDSHPETYESLGGVIVDDSVAIGFSYAWNSFSAPVKVISNEERIISIKNMASSIILSRYPQWKQANMTARMLELVNKKISGAVLTQLEQDEEAAITSAWEWVKSIRSKSDAAEISGITAEEIIW